MRRLLLILLSVAAALAAAEGCLRVLASRELRGRTLEGRIEQAGPLGPGATGRWIQALRVRREPGRVYGLRPGLDGVIEVGGSLTPLRTGPEGFRGPGYAREKPPATVRIAALGDSFMMGSGLAEEDTIPAVLEARLAERFPDRATEVLNAGVAGYNLTQSVAALRDDVLAFDPDLVLLGLLENDRNHVIYVTEQTFDDPLVARRSVLLDALRGREPSFTPEGTAPEDPAGFRRAVVELVRLRDAHDLTLHAFTYYDSQISGWMRVVARRQGLAVASTGSGIDAYMAEHGIVRRGESELVLSPEDGHPSALQVELIVDQLVDQLERRGLLDALYGTGGD